MNFHLLPVKSYEITCFLVDALVFLQKSPNQSCCSDCSDHLNPAKISPGFSLPDFFFVFFWLHVQLNPPIYGTKRPVQCQMVKRPGQAHLSGGHSSAQQLPCGRCRAGRPGRSRLRQLIVCPHWWVTVGWLVNGDLTWYNPQKW